ASDEIGDDFYLTDAISDDAQTNIRNHARSYSESPFFLYLAYTAPHWPLHALPEDIAKYEAYYQEKSFAEIRRSRFEKMKAIGVLPKGAVFSKPSHQAWAEVDQKLNARRMAVYAAMVDCMDRGIGQVIKALEDTGQLENTLICFMTDNGADSTETIGHSNAVGCLGGEAITREGRPVSISGSELPGDETTFQAYGRDWANVSNTPYRYFKLSSYEGGIRSPFILHWPAGVDASRRGSVDHELVSHLIDLSPSFLRLAGEPVHHSMDGISVVQYWSGQKTGNPQRTLYNEFGKSSAMFDFPWKLVNHKANSFLFNIEEDASETKDLSADFPERFEAMKREFAAWKSTFEK
ncbi:MAG: sulfatase-like hydrolase/transferase, partial [Verrucomicrobiota bacterium]